MMNTSIFKAIVALAWAGVAISSAAPADATLITNQSGSYALCSASYTNNYQETPCPLAPGEPEPFTSYYQQYIKLVTTGCSLGGCTPGTDNTWTDIVYPAGRKTASRVRRCQDTISSLYNLGSCAC